MLGNCILNILELNWYERFGEKERKHWNFVIIWSRRPLICKADHFTGRDVDGNGGEMYRNENCTCKACKVTVFMVKYANWSRSCCCRRRGFLSSLLMASERSCCFANAVGQYRTIICSFCFCCRITCWRREVLWLTSKIRLAWRNFLKSWKCW